MSVAPAQLCISSNVCSASDDGEEEGKEFTYFLFRCGEHIIDSRQPRSSIVDYFSECINRREKFHTIVWLFFHSAVSPFFSVFHILCGSVRFNRHLNDGALFSWLQTTCISSVWFWIGIVVERMERNTEELKLNNNNFTIRQQQPKHINKSVMCGARVWKWRRETERERERGRAREWKDRTIRLSSKSFKNKLSIHAIISVRRLSGNWICSTLRHTLTQAHRRASKQGTHICCQLSKVEDIFLLLSFRCLRRSGMDYLSWADIVVVIVVCVLCTSQHLVSSLYGIVCWWVSLTHPHTRHLLNSYRWFSCFT